MAYGSRAPSTRELSVWKARTGAAAAWLLGILFLVAGIWKLTDPFAAAVRLVQAQVPGSLGLPSAIGLGISEVFCGVLLVEPRFRRWGAWLTGLLLVAFVVYIGYYYDVLRGEECNCFPWVERAVGPAFFIGDGVMLLMAIIAGVWARPSEGRRGAALVLAAVSVFAVVSYGVAAAQRTGAQAPEMVVADGSPVALREGRVFLYFFDPECLHCEHVAQDLAKLDWNDTTVLGVVTRLPEFAPDFMESTGLRASVTADAEVLRETFSFVDVPFGVALVNGRQAASFIHFDEEEPVRTLRRLDFVR